MSKIKKWEITGAVLTIILGSLLHFVFAWSGRSSMVALFAAVNESTWEHLKLAFWPTFIFALIEWLVWGRGVKNFCLVSMVKLLSMLVLIIILFYGWLLFFPDNFIWDISIFAAAVIIGYSLSYRLMKIKKDFKWEKNSIWLIIIILVMMSLFTFSPPKFVLFKDPVNGGYGIPTP